MIYSWISLIVSICFIGGWIFMSIMYGGKPDPNAYQPTFKENVQMLIFVLVFILVIGCLIGFPFAYVNLARHYEWSWALK